MGRRVLLLNRALRRAAEGVVVIREPTGAPKGKEVGVDRDSTRLEKRKWFPKRALSPNSAARRLRLSWKEAKWNRQTDFKYSGIGD